MEVGDWKLEVGHCKRGRGGRGGRGVRGDRVSEPAHLLRGSGHSSRGGGHVQRGADEGGPVHRHPAARGHHLPGPRVLGLFPHRGDQPGPTAHPPKDARPRAAATEGRGGLRVGILWSRARPLPPTPVPKRSGGRGNRAARGVRVRRGAPFRLTDRLARTTRILVGRRHRGKSPRLGRYRPAHGNTHPRARARNTARGIVRPPGWSVPNTGGQRHGDHLACSGQGHSHPAWRRDHCTPPGWSCPHLYRTRPEGRPEAPLYLACARHGRVDAHRGRALVSCGCSRGRASGSVVRGGWSAHAPCAHHARGCALRGQRRQPGDVGHALAGSHPRRPRGRVHVWPLVGRWLPPVDRRPTGRGQLGLARRRLGGRQYCAGTWMASHPH